MARIAGVDLPNDKRVEIGLTYIYGIGRPTANDILSKDVYKRQGIKYAGEVIIRKEGKSGAK